MLRLSARFPSLAKQKVLALLRQKGTKQTGILYRDLFGEALSFPLVRNDDLLRWLTALKPSIEFVFSKSADRPNPRIPSPFFEDGVIVRDANALALETKS